MRFFQVGQSIIYHLTEADQKAFGGNHDCGEHSAMICPGTIVNVWGDTSSAAVNIQLSLDSPNCTAWKTSITMGKNPGQFELTTNGFVHGVEEKLEKTIDDVSEGLKKAWHTVKDFAHIPDQPGEQTKSEPAQ